MYSNDTLTCQYLFCEKITERQIWGISWVVKQFEAQFFQFDHGFHRFVTRSIVLIKKRCNLLHLKTFFLYFCTQSLCNNHCLLFYFCQDSQSTMHVPKYACITLPMDLGLFGQLSSTTFQLAAVLFDSGVVQCSDESMFHPPHISMLKIRLYFTQTAPNSVRK